jgi:TDG/mug DNA glycosylase family protein
MLTGRVIGQKHRRIANVTKPNQAKRFHRRPPPPHKDRPNLICRPTKTDLLAAINLTVPDVIAPGLRVLFCGINPGLYTAWAGHHFARPGNRFWPALFASGFTRRLFRPDEERELLSLGYGITNIVARATVAADELNREELVEGACVLRRKLAQYEPKCVAILGLGAYRSAFERPKAGFGLQPNKLGKTPVWILPNPSGLNAHFTPKAFAQVFSEFRLSVLRGTLIGDGRRSNTQAEEASAG